MATVDTTLNLLVPIHLEAMVVNGNASSWKDTTLNLANLSVNRYQNNGALGYYLEKSIPEGTNKNEGGKVLKTGIHLHWIMPDALRKGTHAQDGTFEFPAVPNRWLVIRSNKNGELKSWVVQSDYLNSSTTAKYNYIKENAGDKTLKAIKMGADFDLKSWPNEDTPPAIEKLTIMAPGNPEFAASYLSCKGVFGFHDNMLGDGGQLMDGGEFSYQVYGWYADKSQDPMGNIKNLISLTAKLKKLSWALEDLTALRGDLPKGTVCYAMVHTVQWKSKPQNRIPSGGIKIGIGNTVSEALASMLPGETIPISSNIREKLLAAYQYKSLVDSGLESYGLDLLNKKVHAKSFLPVDAGVQWVVQPPEKKAGDTSNETIDKSLVPFVDDVSAALYRLNSLQEKYNTVADTLAAEQAELYALKYKLVFSHTVDSGQGDFTPAEGWGPMVKGLENAVGEKITAVNKLMVNMGELLRVVATPEKIEAGRLEWPEDYKGSIADQYDSLKTEMQNAGMINFEIKKIAAPQYYEPVDPAVVITGLEPSQRYFKSSVANLSAQNDDGKLKCRTPYLLANQLYIEDGRGIGAGAIFPEKVAGLFALMDQKCIPAGIKGLISESLLLNPLMATEISRASTWGLEIDAIKHMLLNYSGRGGYYKHAEGANVQPAWLPPVNAVSAWEQPWTPLYLEWGVNWQKLQAPGVNALENWKFGDAKHLIDFKYGASLKNYKGADNSTPYYGRTLLSSQFADKVKSLNATINSLFKEDLFNEFKPMAQSLGGFTTQLIQRYHGVQLPIMNCEGEVLKVDKDYSLMGNQNSWRPLIVNHDFTPLRAGLMGVTMLRVIDSFGQALNVLSPGRLSGAKRRVFENSPGLRQGGDINKFELEPRIVQPARLRFDWLSATDFPVTKGDKRVTDSDPATSPVCGWLLYNKLDNHIVVYEASGVEAGYFVKNNAGNTVRLITPAGKPPVTDKVLQNVMDFIGFNLNNFNGMCKQIGAVTKKIQSKYSRQQLTMALPTGFPMAIVSAQFKIELKGLAAKDQSWLGGLNNAKFTDIDYAVTIGNAANKTDGLVGYFLNEEYNRFMVSAGEKDVPMKFKNTPGKKFLTDVVQKITILMDPRTMVTITTGLLPMGNYELPQHTIAKALKKINIRILAAPVITPVDEVKIPLLKSNDATWDFVTALKVKPPLVAEEGTSPLNYKKIQATEGWLTLVAKTPESK